jgi:hypothetical protein
MPTYGKVKVQTLTYDSSGSAVDLAVGDIAPKASPTFTGTITGATAVLTGDLTVDTNTLKVDSTNNRVGIGTTSPEGLLHLEVSSSGASYTADSADTFILERNGGCVIDFRTPSANDAGLIFSDNDARAQGTVLYNHSDNHVQVGTAGSERFRVASAGQLGIGGANYGTSGQVLTSGGASAAPSWADAGGGAFAEYDAIWLGGDDTYLSADRWGNNHLGSGGSRGTLTRVTNLTPVGNGLTISTSGTSGYITFPSTGLWKIDWHTQVKRDTAGNFEIEMRVFSSTDSGSNFAQITPKSVFPMDVPSGQQTLANHVFFYNVTNASTQRIFLAMYNPVGYDFHTSKNTMIEFSKIA